MSDRELVNGVDVAHVRSIAAGFKADPPSGRTEFGARVRWIDGYRTEASLAGDLRVDGDEPTELAGGGGAPSPEDLLLAAVGQCLTVGWVGTLSSRGYRISSLTIDVHGAADLAVAYGVGTGNPGFDAIEVDVTIESDAPQDVIDGLADEVLAQAPIPNTVLRPIPVRQRLAHDA
jgi:uncharacterized OsmC-like protein